MDFYFKNPVKFDFIVGGLLIGAIAFVINKWHFEYPKLDYLLSIISDISTVSLTLAGFILTLITMLISFKSTATIDLKKHLAANSVFDIFFASSLYFATMDILKNSVKALTFVAILGYILKLVVREPYEFLMFYYCFLGLVIVGLSLWRSLFILVKIIQFQKKSPENINQSQLADS